MLGIIKRIILVLFLIYAGNTSVLAEDTEQDARDYYRLGNVYYQQGRYKEAEEMFEKALDLLKEAEASPVPPKQPSKQEIREEKATEIFTVPKPITRVETRGAAEYIIGDEDVLHISVWQSPDLDQEAIVRPDGKISFPLIGDVQASGLTITELDDEITRRLSEFVRSPEVSISIKKIGGKRIVILGQVANPGVYSVTGKNTIMEAIGLAGGFTRDAVPSSTILIRGGFTAPNAQRINLSKLLKGDLRQNIGLQSEDIVFVPRKFISDVNYFLSQILDPLAKGAYTKKELQSW